MKPKRAVIKEELIAITDDATEALILNCLVNETLISIRLDELIMAERKRADSIGKNITMTLTKGWFYKRAEDIAKEIMIIDSVQTIRKKLSALIEKNFVEEKCSDEYKFEKTRMYRVNFNALEKALVDKGYTLNVIFL
ncbi:MAG: hypothetical protein ACM3TR_01035 [Caulobacteraceae bacterium]